MICDYPVDESLVDGGVQAVTKYLVRAMVALGEVKLDVINFDYAAKEPRTFAADGFTRHVLPGGRVGAATGYFRDQRAFNKCLASIGPDIVHSQGAGHDGTLAARSGYPVVITIHGILENELRHLSNVREKLRYSLQYLLSERYCIRKAKHTILISPYVSEHCGDRLKGERHLVPNPIAPEFFDVVRAEEPGRVLFAGRLNRRKGVEELVNAIARIKTVPDCKLILAGSLAETDFVETLRATTERLQAADIVEFRGILDADQLLAEFSRAAVLVLPSYVETAPMVIQEAMASGVPVIASRVAGIPLQVEEGVTGHMVEPGDVDALSARLESLLLDPDLRRSMGAAARAKASREYRADNVARATVEVYRKILSQQDA